MFSKLSDSVVLAPAAALSTARSAFFRTAIIATLAGSALGLGGAAPALAHNGGHNSAPTSCTASATQDPSTGYTWLDVSASGLSANSWYSVFAVQPDGNQIGTAAYADANGYLDTTSLMALQSGTYSVTVNHFHTSSVIQGCSTTVP